MNVQLHGEEFEYVQFLHHLYSYDISGEFRNCSMLRILLYTLREELLLFIKQVFEEFIRRNGLSNDNEPEIRRRIQQNVRATIPYRQTLSNAQPQAYEKRLRLIHDPNTHIEADWGHVAKCYTSRFVTCTYQEIAEFEIGQADPSDVLWILKNCTLFNRLYGIASDIIVYRNIFYGHLPVLRIEPEPLYTFIDAKELLLRLCDDYQYDES